LLLNAAVVGDPSLSGRTKTLLVVEDDVLTRYAVCDALRYAGFTVLEASSRVDSTAILSAVAVDLVFLDLNIPGEAEGLAVAEMARELYPQVKIIVTSGRVPARLRETIETVGPFLPKPYLISRLVRLVRQKLADGAE
jgi:CheY-like chemotaxis protein